MDKPEVPEYVYSAASDVCDRIGDHNSKIFDAIVFGIESAILKAKNDALEEAISVVNGFHHGYTDQGTEGNYRREADVCSHIAQAIRNLKHEG